MAAALAAGYSVENAVRETGRDLRMIYEENADMVQELAAMQRRIDSNQTLEEAMRISRSEAEFRKQKPLRKSLRWEAKWWRSYRNYGRYGQNHSADSGNRTGDCGDTGVQALRAEDYEWNSFVIVLYLRIGCPGFMDPVYGNIVGVCVMTGCLLLYLGAWYLGRRMLEIEV